MFAFGLAVSFIAWYRWEHTLSIHAIVTRRREAFYWLAILFTFALGTSAGDLIAEKLAFGYLPSAGLFGAVIAVIAVIAVAHHRFGLNAVFAFWAAYILTRPFGASMGDFLTASHRTGGLGFGTSALFLAVILACVGYFTVAEKRSRRELELAPSS